MCQQVKNAQEICGLGPGNDQHNLRKAVVVNSQKSFVFTIFIELVHVFLISG